MEGLHAASGGGDCAAGSGMIPNHIKPILDVDAQAYIKRLAGWPYAGVAMVADQWAQRKYHLYREVWAKRRNACPGFKDKHGRPITWATRFEQMCAEPIVAYHARLKAAQTQVAA